MRNKFLVITGGLVALSGVLFFGLTSLAEDAPVGSLATLDPDTLITSDKKSFLAKDALTFSLGVVVETVLPEVSLEPEMSITPSVILEPSVSPTPEATSTAEPSPLSFWQRLIHPVWAADVEAVVVDSVSVKLLDEAGHELTVRPNISTADGHATVSIPDPEDMLSPGQYMLQVTAEKDGAYLTTEHAFTWALTKNGIDATLYNLPVTAEEVPAQRTKKAVTFKLEGRKYAAVGSVTPIFTNDGAGAMVPVEPFGEVRDNMAAFDRLPGDVRMHFRLDRPEYALEKDGLSYSVVMNTGGAGKIIDARTIEYALTDGATLRWRVVGNRVEKAITVTKEGVVDNFYFSVTPSTGLSVILEKNQLLLKDSAGEIKFTAEEPFLTTLNGERLSQAVSLQQADAGNFRYVYSEDGLPLPYVLDPSSGPNNPGTSADDSSVGTVAWDAASITANNASTQNDVYIFATTLSGAQTHYLKVTNFAFSIPTNATIDGIVVEVDKYVSAFAALDASVRIIKGGTIGSADKSAAGTWASADTDTYTSYGGVSDLWGETWTESDIEASTFGFALSALLTSSGSSFVDHIRITVQYTGGSARQRLLIFD